MAFANIFVVGSNGQLYAAQENGNFVDVSAAMAGGDAIDLGYLSGGSDWLQTLRRTEAGYVYDIAYGGRPVDKGIKQYASVPIPAEAGMYVLVDHERLQRVEKIPEHLNNDGIGALVAKYGQLAPLLLPSWPEDIVFQDDEPGDAAVLFANVDGTRFDRETTQDWGLIFAIYLYGGVMPGTPKYEQAVHRVTKEIKSAEISGKLQVAQLTVAELLAFAREVGAAPAIAA